MHETAILWLRRDLRLADNPALADACAQCAGVLPPYIHAPEEESPWAVGSASRWWLDRSRVSLNLRLRELGGRLAVA